MVEFANPSEAIVKGATTGFQMGMQVRQAQWEKKYKQAAFAVELAGKKSVPASVRMQALNKGLLPLLNDKRFGVKSKDGGEFKAFDEASVDSPGFLDLTKKLTDLDKDPDLTPTMKQRFQLQHISDYYSSIGEEEKALETREKMAKGDVDVAGKQDTQGADLRQEFLNRPEIKEYQILTTNFGKVKRAFGLGTAPGDMSGIFAYMKSLDPTSTVREGEKASVEQARGIPESIVAIYNKALSGQALTPRQRAEFVNASQAIMEDADMRYDELHGEYFTPESGILARVGLDPVKYSVDLKTRRLEDKPAVPGAPPNSSTPVAGEVPKTAKDFLKKKGY